MTLDEIRAAAERCLTGHIGTADAVALATFVRDLIDAPRAGELAVATDVVEDDGTPALIVEDIRPEKYDSVLVPLDATWGLAADLLRAAESADGEVG